MKIKQKLEALVFFFLAVQPHTSRSHDKHGSTERESSSNSPAPSVHSPLDAVSDLSAG